MVDRSITFALGPLLILAISVIGIIVSIVVSGAVNLVISRYYFKRASEDLRCASDDLLEASARVLQHNELLLALVEKQGWATCLRDSSAEKVIGVEEIQDTELRFRLDG